MSYCSKQTSINLFSQDKLFLLFCTWDLKFVTFLWDFNALVIFSNKTKDHKIKLKRSNVISWQEILHINHNPT